MMQDDVIPDDDPWQQLLDPHQPSATVDKPFKKGMHNTSSSKITIVQISKFRHDVTK